VSKQGWKDFLAAEGVDDWVVLHGGPTAAFDTQSMPEAARLAAAIAELEGMRAPGVVLTVAGARLTVRLARGVFQFEADRVALARAVSTVALERGATPNRAAVQEVQVAIAAKPDEIDAPFWRTVLGYDELAQDNAIDPLGHGSTVWLQDLDPAKSLRHAMHIDVSLARDAAERRVAAAVEAGGRLVDASNAPGSWILADRAGNKVCVVAWPDGADTPAWAAPESAPPD
jgi:4a-hydroxytetrahydrobiopterin dehydratase